MNPPVQNLDSIDIVGDRKTGGVDLVIVCSGALDDSEETLKLLAQKINNYISGATHPNFVNVYPTAACGPTRVFVSSEYAVSASARDLIISLAEKAAKLGIELKLGRPAI